MKSDDEGSISAVDGESEDGTMGRSHVKVVRYSWSDSDADTVEKEVL